MAQIQLDFFNNKSKKLLEKLPTSAEDPLATLKLALQNWGNFATLRPEFEFSEISTVHTAELLSKLGNSKSECDRMNLMLALSKLQLLLF